MTETVTIADPPEELREQVTNAVACAASYSAITMPEQRRAIGADLSANKALQNRVEQERLLIAKPLTEASRAVNALFKRMSEPLEAAERLMKRAALAWDAEEDRKKAAAYREAARVADAERMRLEEIARQAKADGNVETAAAISAAAQMVAPVPVASEQVKIEGEAHAEIWRAEVINLGILFAVLAGDAGPHHVPLSDDEEDQCIAFFAKLFGPRARALKGALSIPGVRAVSERILRSRAA